MFDRLDDILIRYQQVMEELNDPDVVNDQPRFRKLMKEQNDLAPIVEKYTEYKQEKQNVEDSLELLEMESDEEMRELAKEEMAESKKRIGEIEQELKILLRRIRWTRKMLSWKFVPVPAAMKQRYLRRNYSVCIQNMRKNSAGRLI